MSAQEQCLGAVSNDIANVDTSGYRADRVALAEQRSGGVAAESLGPDTAQGALDATGQALDLAIEGDGWFEVRQPNGQVGLTRNGDFHLDSSGSLVTSAGDTLVPPLRLPPGVDPSSISVSAAGAVTANGAPVGNINLVTVPAPSGLIAHGGGVYTPTAASGPLTPASGGAIRQGFLEGSNADLVDGMTGLVIARDSFDASAAAFRTSDEMLRALLDAVR